MELKIVISADDSALEFSRNLGKLIGQYISQADIEAGLAGKVITATIEPDTMPWEDEVEKGRAFADQAQKAAEANANQIIAEHEAQKKAKKEEAAKAPAVQIDVKEMRAKAIAFGKAHGNDAMKLILAKIGVAKLSDLSADQRILAAQMIDEASQGKE
ncbi:hypothetical protein [uncultured Allobaculum sp.]|uniref:hypothetical protein n=1 Tax=uncultured Allobaculum sp. TaxID=1187017 RepID=UPI00258763FD|nr:hypothetical protein [uncultured Allobaculum sp.]